MEQKDVIFEHLKKEIPTLKIEFNKEDAEFVYLTIYDKEGKDPEEWKVNKADLGLYSKHNAVWAYQYNLKIN